MLKLSSLSGQVFNFWSTSGRRRLPALLSALCFPLFMNSQEAITINEDLQLLPIAEDLYVHISWLENEQYGRFSSNGMVFIQDGKAMIVDTPMEDQLTEDLVTYLKEELQVEISLAVPGHFHDDCLKGLPYLHAQGAHSIAGKKTVEICKAKGLVVPQRSFRKKKKVKFGDSRVELRYFGGGHAPDNIVVWFPDQKVLFGGCLIRSLETNNLGNTGDAVMDEWGPTVAKIQRALPEIEKVIPGHGSVGDVALLSHTIQLTAKKP